jgi:hypothetical protein
MLNDSRTCLARQVHDGEGKNESLGIIKSWLLCMKNARNVVEKYNCFPRDSNMRLYLESTTIASTDGDDRASTGGEESSHV